MKIEEFSKKQFNRQTMKKLLPRPIYEKWKIATYKKGSIDKECADAIAHAMKVWAIDLGATHYCHWFQPLTGLTAQKHQGFLELDDQQQAIFRLSGSNLIKGETDGSSFPNGGLRATFEARGFTYWDINSYAFVRGHVLYIPSIFISYTGQKLDHKGPLLAAMDAFNLEATKALRYLGFSEVNAVNGMVGLEQEYFLVDQEAYLKREDLRTSQRAYFGSLPAKGQEYNDHYFGALSEKVSSYMKEVNQKCWEVGIVANCEHNEVALGQYEFSSSFAPVNIAVDQNMIVMDILQRIALRHKMVCLLHEKPFQGLNGSGKHNNLSFITDNQINLLSPGDNPKDILRFILFMSSFIQSVDRYGGLIRLASSSPGNDFRLGGHEAPPAIVSIYLGEGLSPLFRQLIDSPVVSDVQLKRLYSPLKSISELPYELSDRNRTSPITFTGNRFEIRMLGSSQSASMLNMVILASMAQSLHEFNSRFTEASPNQDEVIAYCHEILKKHQRILFDGDGYSDAWREEAQNRGLPHYKTFVESTETLAQSETIQLLEQFNILSREELNARQHILETQYHQVILSQAKALKSMVNKGILPSLNESLNRLGLNTGLYQDEMRKRIISLSDEIYSTVEKLSDLQNQSSNLINSKLTRLCLGELGETCKQLSSLCTQAQDLIPLTLYPFPTFEELII